jgi:glucose-1-phosphate cytidylyltransferase
VRDWIEDEPFFLTYGDGLSNVDLTLVERTLMKSNNLAVVTAVPLQERFGILDIDGAGCVRKFSEKSDNKTSLINGGFIACRGGVLDYVSKDAGDFSFDGLTRVAEFGKLGYYLHEGFWKAMDTKKDVDELNKIFRDRPELIIR